MSPEARILFCGTEDDYDQIFTVEEILELRVQKLTNCMHGESWQDVIEGNHNNMTMNDVNNLRQKCMLLNLSYQIALRNMNTVTWEVCCQLACDHLNKIGITAATNGKIIMAWNRSFRRNEKLPQPLSGKQAKPLFFLTFPEAEENFHKYCVTNLEDLSVEMVRDYLNDKIIQDLFKKKDNQQYTVENLLLDKMIYAPPSTITIWRWMKRLGYLYTSRTKSFYVDGHAHPAQKQSCREYTKKYPTDWEPRMHRWVQFDKTEVLLQKKEQNIPQEIEGYEYRDENGNDKTEFHVDSCAYLFEYGNKEYQFGGNLSVRMPKGKKPTDDCWPG